MLPQLMSVVAILLSLLCYILPLLINLFHAKNIDNNIADLANKKIASYSKYLPTKEDAFFNNYNEGDSYIIGCWINESTKVRN